MTIASLNPSTGGPARSVPRLGKAIKKTGANVQLFVKNTKEKTEQCQETNLPSISIKAINQLSSTVKAFKENDSNTVLIHNHGLWLPFNHSTSVTAQRHKIPLIISPRGMLTPWARNNQRWKKLLAWILYQRSDLKAATVLHATSKQEANNLQSLGFQTTIAIIPNGVDIPSFSTLWNESYKQKTLLFLSRIHPVKGLINLIRAWADIRATDWQVVIAGPDESNHKHEIKREIDRLGLTKSFSFIGTAKDNDKWLLYNKADLFILPSFSENFGIVIAEALASGTPVITTKGTPWAELEEHNCGWWVDIGVEPLTKALKEAINLSTEERQAMGLRGRKMIEQNYSWDRIGNDMVAVYGWVLHGGSPPNCIVTGG